MQKITPPHRDDTYVSQAVLPCGIYGIWDWGNSFILFLHFKKLFKLKTGLASLACGKLPHPWNDINVSQPLLSFGIYVVCDISFLIFLNFKKFVQIEDSSGSSGKQKITPWMTWMSISHFCPVSSMAFMETHFLLLNLTKICSNQTL